MRLRLWLSRRPRLTAALVLANLIFFTFIFTWAHLENPVSGLSSLEEEEDDLDDVDDFANRPPPIRAEDLVWPTMNLTANFIVSQPEDIGASKTFPLGHAAIKPQFCQYLVKKPVASSNTFHRVQDTFVFSAYYDPRTDPPAIRILGMTSGTDPPVKYCQLWYQNKSYAEIHPAEYHLVPETHDLKYAPSIHVCLLHHSIIPSMVSLVVNKCDSPTHALTIHAPSPSAPLKINFTVCVTPLNFHFNNANQLTEMIELNRILGAGKITFYNHTSGPNVTRILTYFRRRGLVEVVPWKVPVVVDVWPPDAKVQPEIHYFAQVLALNDCLYRNMFKSRFIVFTDLDEFIVPRELSNWHQMLPSDDLCRPPAGSFLFQNCFFRRDWDDDPEVKPDSPEARLELVTQVKTQREANIWPHYSRSKFIVSPRYIVQVGIHFVYEFLSLDVRQCEIPHQVALLHHYRLWEDDGSMMTKVIDRSAHRFRDVLVHSVQRILSANHLLKK